LGIRSRLSSVQEPPHLTHQNRLLRWVVDEGHMRCVMQFDDASVPHVMAEMLALLRLKRASRRSTHFTGFVNGSIRCASDRTAHLDHSRDRRVVHLTEAAKLVALQEFNSLRLKCLPFVGTLIARAAARE
jgi:hypothetical protein